MSGQTMAIPTPAENQTPASRPMRSSNIELLRIVAMLLIVAHHYVVNSTVRDLFNPVLPTANSVFLELFGMWGKTAINVFVLITGYFMCESRLTLKRYMKILLEIVFYSWVMWLVLTFFGYETPGWKTALRRLCCYRLLVGQNHSFVPAFMWMYLMIPFMNVYVRAASRKNLLSCVAVLLALFTGCGTLFDADVFHHVFWYATLYLVGAAVRRHPFSWMESGRICTVLLLLSVLAAWASVVGLDLVAMWLGRPLRSPYFFVSDSHKLLAFSTALFAFLAFKNWRLPPSRFINAVASTTFGVLLIHAASSGMRKWLWQDFIDVPAAYSFSLPHLAAYSLLVVFGVFSVCSALDGLRIRFVERWVFQRWR